MINSDKPSVRRGAARELDGFGSLKKSDASGRLTLGKRYARQEYVVQRKDEGTLVLTPLELIPERERWLWRNMAALSSLRRGLEQSARGEGRYIGSFARYADDEIED